MVDPDRQPLGGLEGIVQVDESEMPFRRKTDPIDDGRGRSKVGKIIIGGQWNASTTAKWVVSASRRSRDTAARTCTHSCSATL